MAPIALPSHPQRRLELRPRKAAALTFQIGVVREVCMAKLSRLDESGRARFMVDVTAKDDTLRESVAKGQRPNETGDPRPHPVGRRPQGRCPRRGSGRGRHGRQAHPRAHPPVPSRCSSTPSTSNWSRTRRRASADPATGPHYRPDRRRDGGPDRRAGRRPHRLRHVQGGGSRACASRGCTSCGSRAGKAARSCWSSTTSRVSLRWMASFAAATEPPPAPRRSPP